MADLDPRTDRDLLLEAVRILQFLERVVAQVLDIPAVRRFIR